MNRNSSVLILVAAFAFGVYSNRHTGGMMDFEPPDAKLLRLLSAQISALLSMQAARELFGKSLFSLDEAELEKLNNALSQLVGPGYEVLGRALAPPAPEKPKGRIGFEGRFPNTEE
jgi:hypothetical protein